MLSEKDRGKLKPPVRFQGTMLKNQLPNGSLTAAGPAARVGRME